MTNSLLNVAMLSLDIFQNDPHHNLSEVERLLADIPDTTDLVVLPELFSTGF